VATESILRRGVRQASARVREEGRARGDFGDDALRATVKAELSTWVIVDDVLEIALLKKNRRGHYDNGCTNADTYWRTLLAESADATTPALPPHAPNAYYDSEYDIERDMGNHGRRSSNAPMISNKSRS